MDTSERKKAEEALTESERRFARVLSNAHAYIYRCRNHPSYPNEFASEYALTLTGYAPQELMLDGEVGFGDLIVEEDKQRVWEEVQRALGRRESFEVRYAIRRRDGEIRHVQEYGQGVYGEEGEVVALEGLIYDVTERERTVQRLREAEQRYRTLIEQIPAIVYIEDMNGRMTTLYDSPQIEAMLGYPQGRHLEDPDYWVKIIHPDDRERLLAESRRASAVGEPFSQEYRVLASDGRVVWVRDEAIVVRDEAGEPLHWQGFIFDITELKEAEEKLRTSEAELRAIFEAMTDVILEIDREGRYLKIAPTNPSLLYRPSTEMLGKTLHEVFEKEQADAFLAHVRHALETQRTVTYEHKLQIGEQQVWFESTFSPMLEDSVIVVARDVTERREAEEALRRSQESLAEAQRMAHLGNWEWNLLSGEVWWSEEVFCIYGYEGGEFTPTIERLMEVVHPEERDLIREKIEGALYSGEPYDFEHRIVRPDGSERVVHRRAEVIRDEGGEPLRMVGTVQDVTERKRAEEALENERNLLRTLIDNLPDYIYVKDEVSRFVINNTEHLRVLGAAEQSDVVGKTDFDVFPRELAERYYADEQEVVKSGRPLIDREEPVRDSEGNYRWVSTTKVPLRDSSGEIVGLVGMSRDITERKRVEEVQARLARQAELRAEVSAALAESGGMRSILQGCVEALVRHLDAAFARIWTLNEEEDVLELQASAGMYTHLDGAHSRVPVGSLKIGLIAQERMPHLTNDVLGDPRISDREWAKRVGMVGFAGYPLIVEDRLVGVVAMFAREELAEETIDALRFVADSIAQGIERKRIEEALHHNEARFRALVQNSSDVVAIINAEGTVTYESSSVERVLGYKSEELVGKEGFALVHPDDIPMAQSAFAELLSAPGATSSAEVRARHRDGSWRCLEVIGTNLVHEPSVAGIVANYRDITERKQAEEEIKEANRRLEELAVLKADFTAMVAHELDTPLAVIRGFADMLATGELEPPDQDRALSRIQAETDMLNALIADVRTAAAVERDDFAIEPKPVPVGSLLEEAAAFARTLPGDHPLTLGLSADGRVLADPYRIGQVLRNLLSNAAKYSPDGAPVELRTLPGMTEGRIRIEVVDQGVGIHPDDAARIFEKFGRGRDGSGRKVTGVGLGLYLSRRILRAHGSDLTLDPNPGGGSVFGFELEAHK